MNASVIAIRNLRVRFGAKTLLAIDQLSLPDGELLAVMGPNGAGKSTLLRSCLGMQPHVSGGVSIFGQRLDALSQRALTQLRRSIGYVPQCLPARSELPLTVNEVVAIGRTGIAGLFRPLRKADWQIVGEWLDRLGITELANRSFSEISGGEQRKAMIARTMVQQPRLLLLDEPTANLDLGWRERIVETIQWLYEQTRVAVVLVCHEMEVLPPGCQNVVLLDHGKILAAGTPEQVLTVERISALYGVGLSVVHQHGRHAVVPAPRPNPNRNPQSVFPLGGWR